MDWLKRTAEAVGAPIASIVAIEHRGQARVAMVGEKAIVKWYTLGSKELASAVGADRMLRGYGVSARMEKYIVADDRNAILQFERAGGEPLKYSRLGDERYRAGLVRALSTLHSVHGEVFSKTLGGAGRGTREWVAFVDAQLASCDDRYGLRVGQVAPHWYREKVREGRSLLEACADDLGRVEPTLCHRDITCENVFVDGDEATIIDFDLAAFYDPLMDLVKLELFAPRAVRSHVSQLCLEYAAAENVEGEEYTVRMRVVRLLELLWGYPALLAMGSPAATKWEAELGGSN